MSEHTGQKRNKILFIIDKWQAGGRQRVLQHLIDSMDPTRFESTLLILSKPNGHFPLPQCKTIIFPHARYRSYVYPLASIFRKERPDIISSHLGILMTPVIHLGYLLSMTHARLIHSIHSTFDLSAYSKTSFPKIYRSLISFSLRQATSITVVACGMKDLLARELHVPIDRIHVVSNPVFGPEFHPSDTRGISQSIRVISIGRLAYPKDFSTLLRAFAIVREKLSKPISLSIIGDGADRERLLEEAHKLKIDESVFKGETTVEAKTFEDVDICILSSRSESLGMTLVEALACGVPVIATDCDFGPREIIQDGKNGLLVPENDPQSMADAIVRLCTDKELIKRISKEGPSSVTRYEVRFATQEWQKMFLESV